MYKKSKLLLILCLLLFIVNNKLQCQVKYSKTDFRSPIGIPIILAGNFAELRTNHFHSGIDIKTKGSQGYRIYSIDSGYVSRINISHWGYGKAIYVNHPNGYTSVYAHLRNFPEKIEKFIREEQFKQQKETISVYFEKNKILVNKGEIIAFSGNTGGSSAPHLHFEIRETISEKPVNPLLFNFDVKDDLAPSIYNIKIYPLSNAKVNKSIDAILIPVIKENDTYSINTPISAFEEIGIGIHTIDKLSDSYNKCGIYSIKLFKDKELIFHQQMDKLDFSTSRYINTHKDYLEYKKNKHSIHKSFISDNNELNIYKTLINKGNIYINENRKYYFKYVVSDVFGNTSNLNFTISGDSTMISKKETKNLMLDAVKKSDSIIKNDFVAIFSSKSLYKKIDINYKLKDTSNKLSATHTINSSDIPIHKAFVLKLKLKEIPSIIESKAIIVEHVANNNIISRGGKFNNNWIETNVKCFGTYSIKIDTIAPVIKAINIYENKILSKQNNVKFKITDNLSGINNYDIWVDDTWMLANYSPKTANLILTFNKYNKITKGKHKLKIKVKDERNNISEKIYNFTY